MKSRYCQNSLWKQLQLLTPFTTHSIIDVWQDSEYASVSHFEYTRVLNMLESHRVLNMPEYEEICWFLFYFPIVIACILKHMVTYFNFYTKLEVIAWRNTRLFFLKRQILIFFIAGRIWFVLYFRIKIYYKISNTLFIYVPRLKVHYCRFENSK